MIYRRNVLLPALVLALLAGWHAGPGQAQTAGQPEHFTATYVDINTGRTGSIDIDVTRWSTNKEREALVQTLFKQGSDGLLSALRDQPSVGRIYTTGSIGYELRYAQQRQLPEGRREIILATDRPMSFREMVDSTRSAQYPFTWVQFQIPRDGTGEGKLAVAARITGEETDRLIEVEDFATQPIKLQDIKSRVGDR
jgi:hypothetical protein